MLIRLIKYIKGYVLVRVTGYSPERFLNLCSNHDILLWDLKNEGDAYCMYMSIAGFRRLKPILKKTKTRTVILEKHGLPFFLHKYRKRKMFMGGIFLCVILVYILSLFIWNIHIDGNFTHTDDMILEFLAGQNTYHGLLKKDVDCEKIVSDIRKEYDDITWVSAEIRGTRLIIKVKENTDSMSVEEVSDEPADLVAEKEGVITEIVTRSGIPAVSLGSVVKEGDLLVSGRIEVLNDIGEVAGYQYTVSDSDIYAKTVYNYEHQFSMEYVQKNYSGASKKSFYLKLFNKKINLWSPKHGFELYDTVTDENQWKLGENFYLPFSIGSAVYTEYQNADAVYTEEEAQMLANSYLEQYLEELSKKGVQIVENNVKILVENGTCYASGKIHVIEQIGISSPTTVLPDPAEEEERTDEDEPT